MVAKRDGGDLTIISTGGLLRTAVQVAEALAREGIEARVLSMHTLKPLDRAAVLKAAQETRAVVTLEEHSIIGGLGGAVAEVLAEEDRTAVAFKRIGIPSTFALRAGSQEYLRNQFGLSTEAVLKTLAPLVPMLQDRP